MLFMKRKLMIPLCLTVMMPFSTASYAAFENTIFGKVALRHNLEPELLYAVALAESGYSADPGSGKIAPHPFAIRSDHAVYPSTIEEARQELRRELLHSDSIDVGIMQINTRWNRNLFRDHEQLLEPETNLELGAQILRRVLDDRRYSELEVRIGHYHSFTDEKQIRSYGRYVMEIYRGLKQLHPEDITSAEFATAAAVSVQEPVESAPVHDLALPAENMTEEDRAAVTGKDPDSAAGQKIPVQNETSGQQESGKVSVQENSADGAGDLIISAAEPAEADGGEPASPAGTGSADDNQAADLKQRGQSADASLQTAEKDFSAGGSVLNTGAPDPSEKRNTAELTAVSEPEAADGTEDLLSRTMDGGISKPEDHEHSSGHEEPPSPGAYLEQLKARLAETGAQAGD